MVALYVSFRILQPFITILHELGHAIPFLFFTKQSVTLYIGSYGNPEKYFDCSIGLLHFRFRYNPFLWNKALCVPTNTEVSVPRLMVCIIAGPLTPFIVGVILTYCSFFYDFHGSIKLLFVAYTAVAFYDLFINLVPKIVSASNAEGGILYNDGTKVKQLFFYKIYPQKYNKATEHYNHQRYAEAAAGYDEILKNGITEPEIYRLAIASFMFAHEYETAQELCDEFINKGAMNSDDYANAGYLLSLREEYTKALEYYDKALELQPDNFYPIYNKAFTLNFLEKYHDAMVLFNKAIELDPTVASAYSNRALSRFKTGMEAEGHADIASAFEREANCAYRYRNLGIYHYDKEEYATALGLFRKAKEQDPATHQIDHLIQLAEMKGH